jgi:uncharacterized protein
MKINQEQIKYLCQKVFDDLKSKEVLVLKTDESKITKRMMEEMEKNFKEEEAIDAEAKKMLAQYKDQIAGTGANQSKLFAMLKKEIAKKKGFIL